MNGEINIAKLYELVKPLLHSDVRGHANILVLLEIGRTEEARDEMNRILTQWYNGRQVDFDTTKTIGLF